MSAHPLAGATRAELEQRWLDLTRRVMPALAAKRAWPVRADHCFQRILLDNACDGRWYDHISGRPAYRAAAIPVLVAAVDLADAVIAGRSDLVMLNRRSLQWRAAAKPNRQAGRRNDHVPQ